MDITVLDFSKAFDTILTNCTQRVLVEGHGSRLVSVRSGVAQGTVLGLLLFLAFINDLSHHVQSQIRLFADDCLLYHPICDVSDSVALQRDLSSIESWSEAGGLRFNIQKCNIISTGKRPFFYQLDGCIVKHVSNHPYLGVELSESLTFSVHIANIVSSACQKLGFLHRNLKRCPRDVTSLAYYAFVRSRLEYCCAIWDPHQVGDINRLEGVQYG